MNTLLHLGKHAHRALLGVGFYTGLRSREIRFLKISDITEVDGHRIIRTMIKGGKPHEVPINPEL
jgi:integrase